MMAWRDGCSVFGLKTVDVDLQRADGNSQIVGERLQAGLAAAFSKDGPCRLYDVFHQGTRQ